MKPSCLLTWVRQLRNKNFQNWCFSKYMSLILAKVTDRDTGSSTNSGKTDMGSFTSSRKGEGGSDKYFRLIMGNGEGVGDMMT